MYLTEEALSWQFEIAGSAGNNRLEIVEAVSLSGGVWARNPGLHSGSTHADPIVVICAGEALTHAGAPSGDRCRRAAIPRSFSRSQSQRELTLGHVRH